MIERYGSGIQRILKICEEYGGIEISFEEIFNGFRVILFKKTKVLDGGDIVDETGDVGKDVTKDDTVNDTVNDTVKRIDLIIEELKKNPYVSYEGLCRVIKKSRKTVYRDIEKMKKLGLIQRVGADKTGYWEILNTNSAT